MTVVESHHEDVPSHLRVESRVDYGATLAPYRCGVGDPTTRIHRVGRGTTSTGVFTRATFTPDGPATVHLRWGPGPTLEAETWGPGAHWLLDQVPELLGSADPGAAHLEDDPHPVIAAAARRGRCARFGASGTLSHELLPTEIEQRITSKEAKSQYAALCRELAEPAPGPFAGLLLPPAPNTLRQRPSWWYHPLGIERKRVQPLAEIALHASKLWEWAMLPPDDAGRRLRLIPGVGVWTTGVVLGRAMGDTDAVPVGDYHIKNIVANALAGEARATDERMLELLAPYGGQRGRVVRLLKNGGYGAPKFGPRQRILPMARW